MTYPWMAPPFEMKPFEEMNKKEAKQHFDWYISQIPERIEVLKELTEHKISLDYSKESLIPLFDWYLSQVTIYKLSDKEIEAELEDLRQYPDFVYKDEKESLLANPVEFKKEDYALAIDIAIYYAETIIKNYPQVKWTFFTKPKSFVYLNEPILSNGDNEIFYERNPRILLKVIIGYIKKNDIENSTLYESFLMDAADILGEDDDED